MKNLLPPREAIQLMDRLLSSTDVNSRMAAIDLLNVRLKQSPSPFTTDHITPLAALARRLCDWLVVPKAKSSTNRDVAVRLAQLSAGSLRLFIRVLRNADKALASDVMRRYSLSARAFAVGLCRRLVQKRLGTVAADGPGKPGGRGIGQRAD